LKNKISKIECSNRKNMKEMYFCRKVAGNIFITISVLICFNSCLLNKRQIIEKVSVPEKIILIIIKDEQTKINNLYFMQDINSVNELEDVSEEVKETEEIETKKEAGDNEEVNDVEEIVKDDSQKTKKSEEKYITDPLKIVYYSNLFEKIKDNIEEVLFTEFHNKKLEIELYRNSADLTSGKDLIMQIILRNYEEGEFNLIKNRDTKIRYDVNIMNIEEKLIANFSKNYILRTDHNFPLEIHRISEINKKFSADLTGFLLNVLKKE
jgi:hypothetical protein